MAGRSLAMASSLAAFYRARNHAPVWTAGAPDTRLDGLLAAIDASAAHGLPSAAYHRAALAELRGASSPAQQADLELLASDAFLLQVRHRTRGAVDPATLDPEWLLPPPEVDGIALLAELASGRPVKEVLALWPTEDEYRQLLDKRRSIVALGRVERVAVPPGPTLRPGMAGERVRALKERLYGPGQYDETFDAELERAVRAWQDGADLESDGIVGANTLAMLNENEFSWIDRIDANLERWRWLPRDLPRTHIRVNIASFRLRVIDGGEDVLAMNVIAGRPQRRTPVFTETLKYMVFHPFWNVPRKLAVQDKLPLLKADADAQAALGLEARRADGEFVSVAEVDWSGVTAAGFPFLLRQRPGPANALGRVKFMLPNPYAIYLHDTPNRELFAKRERALSSGCIRLGDPVALANWLLTKDANPAAGELDALFESGETRTVYLNTPISTLLVYFTAFVDETDQVVFRRDVYDRDLPLVAQLRQAGDQDALTPP